MATALIPLVFMIVRLLIYVLASNPKVAELGRIAFWAGSFAIALAYAGRTVTLLGG